MKELTVGFSKSKKKMPIASWLIMLYEGTGFSHTYLRETLRVFKDDLIIHASEGAVQRMSQYQFDKKHEVVEEFIIEIEDKELYQELKDKMHKYSGAPYSIMQNVGIIYVNIMKCLNRNVENPWQIGWNCSELVMVVLESVYPEEFSNYRQNTVTPKEIHHILSELCKKNLIKRKI